MGTAAIFAIVIAASAAIARWWDARRLARDLRLPLPAITRRDPRCYCNFCRGGPLSNACKARVAARPAMEWTAQGWLPAAEALADRTAHMHPESPQFRRLRANLIASGNWNAYLIARGQRRGLGMTDGPF